MEEDVPSLEALEDIPFRGVSGPKWACDGALAYGFAPNHGAFRWSQALLPWIREALGPEVFQERFEQLALPARPPSARPPGGRTPRLKLPAPQGLREQLDRMMASLQSGQDRPGAVGEDGSRGCALRSVGGAGHRPAAPDGGAAALRPEQGPHGGGRGVPLGLSEGGAPAAAPGRLVGEERSGLGPAGGRERSSEDGVSNGF